MRRKLLPLLIAQLTAAGIAYVPVVAESTAVGADSYQDGAVKELRGNGHPRNLQQKSKGERQDPSNYPEGNAATFLISNTASHQKVIADKTRGLPSRNPRRDNEPDLVVAPHGDDTVAGTLESPLATINGALVRAKPGDTIAVRGGTYSLQSIDIHAQGSPETPIRIVAYQKERPWFTGGTDRFSIAPNQEWEIIDPILQIYRSKAALKLNRKTARVGGWLIDNEIQLITYLDYGDFSSRQFGEPSQYIGPGIYIEQQPDGTSRVLVRLQQNSADLVDPSGNALPDMPRDKDPNRNRILIFDLDTVLAIADSRNIQFEGIIFGPAWRTVTLSNADSISFENCTFYHKTHSILALDTAKNVLLRGNRMTMGFPRWVHWVDVKDSPTRRTAYDSLWNSFAVSGRFETSHFEGNLLHHIFDGFALAEGSRDVSITRNVIHDSRDDAIDLTPGLDAIRINDNIMRHVFSGISVLPGSGEIPAGKVQIIGNVLDLSKLHGAGRPGQENENFAGEFFSVGSLWTGHGCSGNSGCTGFDWTVTNNSLMVIQRPYFPPFAITGIARFLNNLFFDLGQSTTNYSDRVLERAGNFYWSTGGNPAVLGEPEQIVADPKLNMLKITEERYDYMYRGYQDLYRPRNPAAFSKGAAGMTPPPFPYRGAIARR